MKSLRNRYQIVADVLNSESEDFVELCQIAGIDKKCDFVFGDLADVDFGEANLDGFSFKGANLTGSNLSRCIGITVEALEGVVFDKKTLWPFELSRAMQYRRSRDKYADLSVHTIDTRDWDESKYWILHDCGDYKGALAYCDLILEDDPFCESAVVFKAHLVGEHFSKPKTGIKILDEYSRRWMDSPNTYFFRGQLYEKLKNYGQVEKNYTKAIDVTRGKDKLSVLSRYGNYLSYLDGHEEVKSDIIRMLSIIQREFSTVSDGDRLVKIANTFYNLESKKRAINLARLVARSTDELTPNSRMILARIFIEQNYAKWCAEQLFHLFKYGAFLERNWSEFCPIIRNYLIGRSGFDLVMQIKAENVAKDKFSALLLEVLDLKTTRSTISHDKIVKDKSIDFRNLYLDVDDHAASFGRERSVKKLKYRSKLSAKGCG